MEAATTTCPLRLVEDALAVHYVTAAAAAAALISQGGLTQTFAIATNGAFFVPPALFALRARDEPADGAPLLPAVQLVFVLTGTASLLHHWHRRAHPTYRSLDHALAGVVQLYLTAWAL